jgi:hypothetical protein
MIWNGERKSEKKSSYFLINFFLVFQPDLEIPKALWAVTKPIEMEIIFRFEGFD